MKHEIKLSAAGRQESRHVELQCNGQTWHVLLDGHPLEADAVEIAPNTFSVLLHGKSHELRVTPLPEGALQIQSGTADFIAQIVDTREWRGRHGSVQAEGRQHVTAPMPGKIVRVLVSVGEKVDAGQGLLVVEAMKMQNEIRSPKTGTVEEILAVEGHTVNPGDVLCVVS